MAALEVDLSKIEMGQTVTVKWRGKPVFVRRRSEQEVEAAGKVRPPSRTPPCCTAAHVSVVTAEPVCRAACKSCCIASVVASCHSQVEMMSSHAKQVSLSELRDPEPDSDRATNPEVSLLTGNMCTQLQAAAVHSNAVVNCEPIASQQRMRLISRW